jgi:dephospho-CoA kinase
MILGLTGEKLSGKDTVAEFLVQKHKAAHIRHSQILDEILQNLDLPVSRRNEIDLGMGLRQVFGNGVLGRALRKRVTDTKNELIVINGIRFQDELQNARELGAKIIYITAPEDVRYQRFLKRQEKTDDATQNLDQFRLQEQEPTEIGIPSLGAQADIQIDNIGTIEQLYQKVEKIL